MGDARTDPTESGTKISAKTGRPLCKPRGKAWAKGQSGNPTGKPRVLPPDVSAVIRSSTLPAIMRIAELVRSADPRIALRASEIMLDRGLGAASRLAAIDVPSDPEARLAALEGALHRLALAGDSGALSLCLRVAAPDKYGDAPPQQDAADGIELVRVTHDESREDGAAD